ncbi:MAG: hypothetical protein WA117_01885, partial [Verrucomicrobiia bacterium]
MTKITCFILVAVLLGADLAAGGDGHCVVENGALRVTVDETNATWEVLDKRCNRLWRQAVDTTGIVVKSIKPLPSPAKGAELHVLYSSGKDISLPLTVRVCFAPGQADVAYEISGDFGATIKEVNLPAPFILDDAEGYLVIPHNAGLLFGVNELEWNGKALGGFMSMPW